MKVYKEIECFNDLMDMCWSGAISNLERAEELGREDELFERVEEVFGDEPIDETAINDYIWFEVDEEMGLWEDNEEE